MALFVSKEVVSHQVEERGSMKRRILDIFWIFPTRSRDVFQVSISVTWFSSPTLSRVFKTASEGTSGVALELGGSNVK